MNAKCRTPRARSLSPPPGLIGDPISNSGFEFSINFSASGLAIGFAEIPIRQIKSYRATFTFCLGIVSVELSLLLLLLLSAA